MQADEGSNIDEKVGGGVLCPLSVEDESELAEALKAFVAFEMDNEKAKQQLSLKTDFNLLDAFRLFDKFNLGHIYKLDFEEGLKRLGVFTPAHEIDLLFKRYDTD
jgi:predicted HTH transcriptional regulator